MSYRGIVDYDWYGNVDDGSYGILRSPVRNVTYIYAYSVNSNGNAGNNITDISNSYGSPGTDWNDCCYYVKSFGILFPRYGNSVEDDPDNSYGK